MSTCRRALWFAAAVSILVLAIAGTVRSADGVRATDGSRATAHQVVADHDAVVSARAVTDRSPLDLRQVHSKLLLLAWIGVLVVAALLARTAGRAVEQQHRRVRSAVPPGPRVDRGPPAPSFA